MLDDKLEVDSVETVDCEAAPIDSSGPESESDVQLVETHASSGSESDSFPSATVTFE